MGKVWNKTVSDQTPLGLTDVCQLELMLESTNLGSHTLMVTPVLSLRALVTPLVIAIPVCAAWPRS